MQGELVLTIYVILFQFTASRGKLGIEGWVAY